MKTQTALAVALFATSSLAFAAPEVEISILGGQTTAPSHFRSDNDNVAGTSNTVDKIEREFGMNSKHVSSDFAPGLRLGVRLGESPVIVQAGARHSDHLDTSYNAGVRLNKMGSNLGLDLRAVHFENSDVREVFGGDVEGEAIVTYDLGPLRLGGGVSSATVDSSAVTGLVTADLVFTFGGPKASTPVIAAPVFKKPDVKLPTPIVETTGERG